MNGQNKNAEPSDPAVVITGATHGVGRALADEFARGGYDLLLVARDEASLTKAAEKLSTYDVEVKVLAADLSTEEGCAAVEQALQSYGLYADMLVNNAAMMMAGFFQDQDPEKLRKLVDLDVRAVVDLTRRLLPGMIARRNGGVLNVASTAAFQPGPGMAVYYATKAFVLSFSEAIAEESAGTGVTVTAVCPGPTATNFKAAASAEFSRRFHKAAMSAETVARLGHRAFRRGRFVAVTGWRNRLLASAVRLTPRRVVRKITRYLNAAAYES